MRAYHGIIVTYIAHPFFGGVFTQLLIKCNPTTAVILGINLMVQFVQLRMIPVNPVQDDGPIVSTEVQILKPDLIALLLRSVDDGLNVGDAGENE